MRIRLLAFASAADALGGSEHAIELAEGSTVRALEARLRQTSPALEPLWGRLAIAVDGELSGPDAALRDDCEVALLPPVSGG